MWRSALTFFRDHVVVTALSCAVAGGFAGWGVSWSLYEAQVNRVAEMRVEAYKGLQKERETFLLAMQSFTLKVASDGTVEQGKKEELAASLARQYFAYSTYASNLPPDARPRVESLQTALNQLKKTVVTFKGKPDLDALGIGMVDVLRGYKAVDPLIDKSVKDAELIAS